MEEERPQHAVQKLKQSAKDRRAKDFKERHGNSKLDEAMKKKLRVVIPNMMGQGATRVELCAELEIHRDTLHDWERKHGWISDLLHMGDMKKDAWWMKKGRIGIEDKNFNANQYKWMTQNVIPGWANKQDITASVNSTEVIQEKARARAKKAKDSDEE